MSKANELSGVTPSITEGAQRERYVSRGVDFRLTQGGASKEDIDPAHAILVRALTQEKITALVSDMVERDIVPRLVLAHKGLVTPQLERSGQRSATQEAASSREPSQVLGNGNLVEQFAIMCIRDEIQTLEVFVSNLIARGLTDEALYLDVMAPTARHLGEMWTADTCTFTDVTIGLGKLQMLLSYLSDRAFYTVTPNSSDLSVLLVMPAGAQHVFGIRMVDELFTRAGWLSRCETSIAPDVLEKLIKNEHFDLFGIGISHSEQVESARALIEIVRQHSYNKHIQVMLGGSLSIQQPDLARSLAVDHTACDAREAVTIAETFINAHKQAI